MVKKLFKCLLLLIVVGVVSILFFYNYKKDTRTIEVTKWDNIYSEDNLDFYYDDNRNETIIKLESTYKVNSIVSKEKKEIKKVLKTIDILNSIAECDDVKDSDLTDGYSILKNIGKSKKVSEREMAVIERDLLLASGFNARVGEYRRNSPQSYDNSSYYVVEYYSTEYKKWVLIDFRDRAYLLKDNKPVSAIDLIGEKIDNLEYKGRNSYKIFKDSIGKYLSSYTIAIDNTLQMKKSNSYLTYISNNKDIDLLKNKNTFTSPSIYTNKKNLFTKEPGNDKINEDKKTYLILQKKQDQNNDKSKDNKKEKEYSYIIGAFNSSKVINNYFIRVNGGPWKQVNNYYYEYSLVKGNNKIELSLNEQDILSTIQINKNE